MPFDAARLTALVLAVALAFAVETALGFGATVVAVSLGALLLPIDVILPAFVPLNLILSAAVFLRARQHVAWRVLLVKTLPWMALGLPLGMLAFARLDASTLRRAFGVFLTGLATLELLREARRARPGALAPSLERSLLVLGGALHGAFATGGPMVVYVLGRTLTQKAALRATLALLWLTMNLILLTQYGLQGKLSRASLSLSMPLAIGLGVGMVTGELLFRRVPEALFRRLVFALLLVAGLLLLR
jgi:uncharacterized membrane protein YfcA